MDLEAEGDDPTPIYPLFDEFDKEFSETFAMRMGGCGRKPRNGHIRIAMINAALDENLARSIFTTISTAKHGTDDVLPLEHLELRPIGGMYTAETTEVAEVVGRWWLLERNPRDDHRDVIVATRLRNPGDLIEEENGPLRELDPKAEPIFRKIWPDTGRNWTHEWSSWPLAL